MPPRGTPIGCRGAWTYPDKSSELYAIRSYTLCSAMAYATGPRPRPGEQCNSPRTFWRPPSCSKPSASSQRRRGLLIAGAPDEPHAAEGQEGAEDLQPAELAPHDDQVLTRRPDRRSAGWPAIDHPGGRSRVRPSATSSRQTRRTRGADSYWTPVGTFVATQRAFTCHGQWPYWRLGDSRAHDGLSPANDKACVCSVGPTTMR